MFYSSDNDSFNKNHICFEVRAYVLNAIWHRTYFSYVKNHKNMQSKTSCIGVLHLRPMARHPNAIRLPGNSNNANFTYTIKIFFESNIIDTIVS